MGTTPRDIGTGHARPPVGLLVDAPISTLIVDIEGRVTWCNPAACEQLARTSSEVIGSHLERFAVDLTTEVSLSSRDRIPAVLVPAGRPALDVALHVASLDDGDALVQIVEAPTPTHGATLEQQRRFRSALLELSELSHDHVDESRFHEVFIRRAIEAVPGAQAGSLLLRRPGTDEFHFVACEGYDLEQLQTRCLTIDQMFRDISDPTATVSRELTADGLDDETAAWLRSAGRIEDIKTNVSSPVFSDGDAVAFVSLDNLEDPAAFDETSVEMTTVLGRLIADLIRRRRLETELRRERESFKQLAHHDGLTGLANRRHIEAKILDAIAEANRTRQPMALLFVDLDDFKQINDTLGHDAGDRVLMAVADTLKLATRDQDDVGRWGGDEFVIVAPGMPSRLDAKRLAQRVLDMFSRELRLDDGRTAACKLSIGVAWSRDGAEGFHTMLRRADEALYQAKLAGKSTVRLDAA